MKEKTNDNRLEYEAPKAEIIRLGTEDILKTSTTSPAKGSMYEADDFGLF